MNARALTGQALAAALRKAVDPAVSEALQRNAERLREALDGVETLEAAPSPLPWGEVGPQGRVRGAGLSGEIATPHPPASPSTFPHGRGEGSVARSLHSLDFVISGSNLFAREFGALDAAADPIIAPALSRLRRRSR